MAEFEKDIDSKNKRRKNEMGMENEIIVHKFFTDDEKCNNLKRKMTKTRVQLQVIKLINII